MQTTMAGIEGEKELRQMGGGGGKEEEKGKGKVRESCRSSSTMSPELGGKGRGSES